MRNEHRPLAPSRRPVWRVGSALGLAGMVSALTGEIAGPAKIPDPTAMTRVVADAALRDHPEPLPFDWGEGVLLAGLMHAHRWTGEARYLEFVRRFADHWAARDLEPVLAEKGYCGHWGPAWAMWLLFEQTGDVRHAHLAEEVVEFMRRRAERTRAGALSHFRGKPQLWVDTLAMVCPVLAHGSRLRQQPAWQAEAIEQFERFGEHLRDPASGLYVHLWDEANGQKTTAFWARGNGWVVVSLVEMIRNEKAGSMADRQLRAGLGRLLAALGRHQDPASGLWHTVLDAPDTPLETSASAMFVYGLAQARRWNLESAPPVTVLRRAWQGLSQQVDAQGRVIGVSAGTIPGDKARYAARPLGTYPWGSGAFLLAAVAMAEFEAGTAADR